MPQTKHRKTVIAVMVFDVDEGCDGFDPNSVAGFIDASLSHESETISGPTYRLADVTVYKRVSDVVADMEDGVTRQQHKALENTVSLALDMELDGKDMIPWLNQVYGEGGEGINQAGIQAQINYLLHVLGEGPVRVKLGIISTEKRRGGQS